MTAIQPENKIHLRHYGFNNYYAVDRAMPVILDIHRNGTNPQWIQFCESLDMTFKHVNNLQSLVFHCKLAVMAVAVIYLLMILIVYTFPPPLLMLYVIAGLIVFVIALNIVVQGPINEKCIGKAMNFVKQENEKRLLQTISGSDVEVKLHYHKRDPFKCEGYELDSQECQRYPNIYIQVFEAGNNVNTATTNSSTGNNNNNNNNVTTNYTTVNNYNNVTTNSANPAVATVASAYVSKKVAPTSKANYGISTLTALDTQEKDRTLEPYVSVPMAKATIIDTPTLPPATKEDETMPSPYVTKK